MESANRLVVDGGIYFVLEHSSPNHNPRPVLDIININYTNCRFKFATPTLRVKIFLLFQL